MLILKYLLLYGGIGMAVFAAGILIHDLYLELQYRKAQTAGAALPRLRRFAGEAPWHWRCLPGRPCS